MKSDTMKKLDKCRVTVEVANVASDVMLYTVEALVKAGISSIAIPYKTLDSSGDNDETMKISGLKKCFGGDVIVGASNVFCDRQVKIAKSAGADFVSSSVVNRDVLERAKTLNIAAFAGAYTATEVMDALINGADLVNLFPTKCDGGLGHAEAIIRKLPFAKIAATDNLRYEDIFPLAEIGIKYFEFGDALSAPEKANNGEYASITEEARRYIGLINNL